MAKHIGILEQHGQHGDGVRVFYAHGSESIRTALGRAKFHTHRDCPALLGRNPRKTVIEDWAPSVAASAWCRVCGAAEQVKRTKITLTELADYIMGLQQSPTKWSLTEIAEHIGKSERFCRRVLRIAAGAKSQRPVDEPQNSRRKKVDEMRKNHQTNG